MQIKAILALALAAAAPLAAQDSAIPFTAGLPASHPAAGALRDGRATALAAADFDGDGVPDLAIAYRLGERGAIAVCRGEYAALYPHFPTAVARRRELGGEVLPFDPKPVFAVATAAADFVAAGDFDADGRADLVWASREGKDLVFHRGDGRGDFAPGVRQPLPAAPTALAAFDLGLADGLPEIVVATGGAGPRLIRYGGSRGAWSAKPRATALDRPATSLLAARLDEDPFYDLAFGVDRGWYRLAGTADPGGLAAAFEGLPAKPPGIRASRRENAAVSLPLRLDGDALPDFVNLDEAGRISFEIHGMPLTFTVNTTDETTTGTCSPSYCSLRQAIEAANASAGPATIAFAISGTPPFRIEPQSPMSESFFPLTIDGSTQPGFAGTPIVEIYGGGAPDSKAIALHGPFSTVRSLSIHSFQEGPDPSGLGHCIWVDAPDALVEGCYLGVYPEGWDGSGCLYGLYATASADRAQIGGTAPGAGNVASSQHRTNIYAGGDDTVVEANIIGLDPSGTWSLSGFDIGLEIGSTSVASVVGGTAAGAGNVMSGSYARGLEVWGGGHRIQGNKIGTDLEGELSWFNMFYGVFVAGSHHLIGGTSAAAANLISGNGVAGIYLWGDDSRIENNRIGVSASGDPLGNSGPGIVLRGNRNRIGSDDPAGGNLIASNTSSGVACAESPGGNRILGNSLYANGAANIACGTPGPALTGAWANPAGIVAEGSFSGSPNRDYLIEFFRSESCVPGRPPAKYLLGFQNVTTGAGGAAAFIFHQPGALAAAGEVVTATASPLPLVPSAGETLNTSDISECRTVAAFSPPPPPALSLPQHAAGSPGATVTLPLNFASSGHAIVSAAFAVDLGGCVSFDPVDANADGLPDSVVPHLPPGWTAAVWHQPGDSDGELKFVFFDVPPFTPLPSGTVAEITLEVVCNPATMTVEPLPFETSPAPSLGNSAAQAVAGSFAGGSIDIQPSPELFRNGFESGNLTAWSSAVP